MMPFEAMRYRKPAAGGWGATNIVMVGAGTGTTTTVGITNYTTVMLNTLLDTSGAAYSPQTGDYFVMSVEIAAGGDVAVPAPVLGYNDGADQLVGTSAALLTEMFQTDTASSNMQVYGSFYDDGLMDRIYIGGVPSSGQSKAVGIQVFRGVHATTQMDVTPTTAQGPSTAVANAPSITPSTPGSLIIGVGGGAAPTGAVYTNPTGMSTVTNHFITNTVVSTADAMIGHALKIPTSAAAFDPAAFGGGTGNAQASWCAATLVLRPA